MPVNVRSFPFSRFAERADDFLAGHVFTQAGHIERRTMGGSFWRNGEHILFQAFTIELLAGVGKFC